MTLPFPRAAPIEDDIVDSHVHVGLPKFPSFDEYRRHAEAAGVVGAVLTQHIGEVNNDNLVACANVAPSDFAVVGMVDLDAPQVSEIIADAATHPVFRGIRLWASSRTRGSDPLEIWRTVAAHRMVASVRGPVTDLIHPSFVEILQELPELVVRIDHLGLFAYGRDPERDFEQLMSLSRFEQVHIMWAGFHAYSSEPYPYADSHPYLRRCLDSFGADRIMWSGDWARNRAARPFDYYATEVRLVQSELDFLTERDRRAVLGGTAKRLFHLAPNQPSLLRLSPNRNTLGENQ